MQEHTARTVAFYIRVSTERQAQVQEGSLKNQEQMLRKEVERRNAQSENWGVFVDAYVDEGLSGKNTNRPAFKQMMQDVEIGRIDTVMFTELSRLSRSLKDFLNIFEFAQKHNCDLICLKTDIDTTSPYKSLITKILMIFAEFEREMTSRRTSLNAYERSKRGLANGGIAPLGYRRDKNRKGFLFIDPAESAIVRDLFATYLEEHSIKRTVESIHSRYGDKHPRVKNLTRATAHTILTNKAYIGVREINKHNGSPAEEVPAVWDPIIDEETFHKVQQALQNNRTRYHAHADQSHYVYLFSGLLRCGVCGEKLQGKSAWSSSTHNRYHYYAHPRSCAKSGLNRIDANLVHRLVLDWLRDIAADGEHFETLRREGVKRIDQRIEELSRELKRIDDENTALLSQIDARIDELTRTETPTVRHSIETSITRLEKQRTEEREKRLYVENEKKHLEYLRSASENLYGDYQQAIQETLEAVNDRSHPEKARKALKCLIASLVLTENGIKIALSGSVNRKALGSTVYVFAPPV